MTKVFNVCDNCEKLVDTTNGIVDTCLLKGTLNLTCSTFFNFNLQDGHFCNYDCFKTTVLKAFEKYDKQ